MSNDSLPICPRCRSNSSQQYAVSATPGVWTMYGCHTCFYVWRSTEPLANTDPDHYPAVFKLSPQDIPKFPALPVIPPLQTKKET